jgi:protein O-mannosyl-transferase
LSVFPPARYTEKIVPVKKNPKDYFAVISVVLVIVVAGWLLAWSNHFESSFHFNDFPTLVSNQSAQHLSNFGRFFTNPRISSVARDSVAYRPLLSAWFAFDYQVLGGVKPFLYQAENFGCFVALLLLIFALFRLFPGVNSYAAGFATLLFGTHPAVADTINYVIQRGVIVAALGVVSGLLIFMAWPWMLPQKFPLKLKRVPEHGFDEYLRKNFAMLEARYLRLIHLPVGMYLWPIVPALLCDASTAVFAPILSVYIVMFEQRRTLLATIPAWVICAGWWIFHFVFTWSFVPFTRVPAANYVFSQPWVAMRYLYRFFVPVGLSVESDFYGFARFWDPLALAGYAGLAALIVLAFWLSRREQWKTVAFGIWWFLIAVVPEAVSRHESVEANWRMFLPFIGLALAAARLVAMGMEAWLPKTEPEVELTGVQVTSYILAAVVGIGLLAVLGWATSERNKVWTSEASLWQDAVQASPGNGRALMRLGLTKVRDRDITVPLTYLKQADKIAPGDPLIEVNLGGQYARVSQSKGAENSFRNAIHYGANWSPAWSTYAEWLLDEKQLLEAREKATKAVALDPYDVTGRSVLMDVFAEQHRWKPLEEFALATLQLLPDDPDAQRSIRVAQAGREQLTHAAQEAASKPSVDNFLKLSVLYYDQERYQDCIEAARQALKIKPDLAEAYANIASAYHTMGNHLDDTIAALQEEVRLNPNLPSAKSNLDIELNVKRGARKD